MESKLKKIFVDSWWCVNAAIIETVEALETRYSMILSGSIQCDLWNPVTLSLSSHTIQSVNNNPWRHWKDQQTSQVNKCPDIFRKCPTGTKLRIAYKTQGKLKIPLKPPIAVVCHHGLRLVTLPCSAKPFAALFCSRVYFCLYGLFNCISFHKFSR